MTAVARQIDPSGGSDGRKSENRTVRAKKTSPQTRCKAPPRHEVVSGYPVDEHQIASRSVAVPGLPADTTRCRSPVPAVARPLISPTDPGTHLGGVVGARRSGRSLQHLRAARGVAVSPGTANDLSGGSGGRKSENRAVRAKKTSPQARCKAPPRYEVVSGHPPDRHPNRLQTGRRPVLHRYDAPPDHLRPALSTLISPTDSGASPARGVGAALGNRFRSSLPTPAHRSRRWRITGMANDF